MGLSCLQFTYSFVVTGDTQHHDSKHITKTSNGNHIGIMIELQLQFLYFVKSNFHLYCVCSVFCITLLNQKSHVISTVVK